MKIIYYLIRGIWYLFPATTTPRQESAEKSKDGLFSLLPKPDLNKRQKKLCRLTWWTSAFVAYNAYLAYAIYYHVAETERGRNGDMGWCDGVGLLILITLVTYIYWGCK